MTVGNKNVAKRSEKSITVKTIDRRKRCIFSYENNEEDEEKDLDSGDNVSGGEYSSSNDMDIAGL